MEQGLSIVRQVVGYIWATQDAGVGYVEGCAKARGMFAGIEIPDDVWSCICIGSISIYEEMNNFPATYTDEIIHKAAKDLAAYIASL